MNMKNVPIIALSLGTAFGLGVLTTVYLEFRLFIDAVEATKKPSRNDD